MKPEDLDGESFFEEPDDEGDDINFTGNIADVLSEVQTLLPEYSVGGKQGEKKDSSNLDVMIPKNIQEWLLGGGATPQSIRSLGNEVTTKMNWTIALILVQQFTRIPRLMHFVTESESALYDDIDFNAIETSEIKERYKSAMGTMNDALEFIRKFSIQNREALSSLTTGTEDESVILQLLRSAPVEKLQKIKKILQEESGDVSSGKKR